MKFIGKLLLTLLLLVVLAIVLLYVVGQTGWAAGWLSRWISDNSEYRLSVAKISHSWNQPGQISLEDVQLAKNNRPQALIAKRVDLGLSLRQITEPRYFHSVTLRDGTLTVQPQTATLPVQADVLQLSNMALQSSDETWQLNAQQVNAGITPWQPKAGHLLGENNQFQFSAGSMTLNGIPASQVLVQGELKQNQLKLNNFGADLAQGDLTGVASRATDGSWLVERLRLSGVRMQTPLTLAEFWQRFTALPPVTLKRFDLIDARLEGKEWAFNDLDLSLQNITFQQGDWRSEDGSLNFNASDLINGGFHLIDPIMNMRLSPAGIAIQQFTSRWEGGLLRTSGNWLRANNRLQLDEVAVAALEYTLPSDWRALWLKPLPHWLAEVYVNKLTTNRNLIIDINPNFPFQITALDGYGGNLLLARDHQWGIWSGTLNLNGSEATFNKIDVRRPSLALNANDGQINVTELSAFMPKGLLEAKATVEQLPGKPFTLSLNGRSVPVNTLQQWGWQQVPLEGDGNLQLQLKGLLNSDGPFKSSLKGELQATAGDGRTVDQQLP
ncbi:AsmA family protein [Serratia sp. AS12]|uniref:AsmA family protein n=1 Tax=Serratia TaxID=613 RepID=UPI00020EA28F|nr:MULTISPECIES: AsmA family protein [Serratia]AEF48052.1 AsmA family protein [Serratia plymuthica AS9]AEF53004.1 AsmA family protein [Serratia sp. AS12]AEG30711.1 AsmA family protein [Serratia sp. AS13]UTN96682.1 AsmA family protein [Serratia plymuthica]